MKQDIILIGGGGHCVSCIDVIEKQGEFNIAGIVDLKEKIGQKVLGYEIIGCDEDLDGIIDEYKNFLITLGFIKSCEKRVLLFNKLKNKDCVLPVIVSPLAYVSKHASIGDGTIVCHGAVVNAQAKIGDDCIINTKALIEHDSNIGSHCHIATNGIVNGECEIGERVLIGSNAVVLQGKKIISDIIIGANSLVIVSLNNKGTYVGTPVKLIEK